MTLIESFADSLGNSLPGVLTALGILVGGWLLAVILRAVTTRLLTTIKLNERVSNSDDESPMDLTGGIARAVYTIVLLVAAIGAVAALDLKIAKAPLEAVATPVLAYLPHLLAAGVLLVVGWILASITRTIATKALEKLGFDKRVGETTGVAAPSVAAGRLLYWLVLLLFVPAVLESLQMRSLLEPFENLVASFVGMIPNLAAAVVYATVGWYLARILRDLVTRGLAGAGADNIGEQIGFREDFALSRLVGLVVQLLVFIPALIAALDALQVAAVSGPATAMLDSVLAAVPHLIAAVLIIGIAWVVGRFVSRLVASLLAELGIDVLPGKLGLGDPDAEPNVHLSEIIGTVAFVFIVLFASVEAANVLEFAQVSALLTTFIAFGGKVVLGIIILVLGYAVAEFAHGAIAKVSGERAMLLAGLARVAILALVLAMGLRAMGIADDIVNIAFGLILGAVAVAFALAFGLGARAAAGRLADHWIGRLLGNNGEGTGQDAAPPIPPVPPTP